MPEDKNGKSWLWKVIGAVIIILSLFGGFKGLEAHFVTKEVNDLQMAGMSKALQRVNLNSEVVYYQQTLLFKKEEEKQAKQAFEKERDNLILKQEWINKINERSKAQEDLKKAEEQRRKCQ